MSDSLRPGSPTELLTAPGDGTRTDEIPNIFKDGYNPDPNIAGVEGKSGSHVKAGSQYDKMELGKIKDMLEGIGASSLVGGSAASAADGSNLTQSQYKLPTEVPPF